LLGIADSLSKSWQMQTILPESTGRIDITIFEVIQIRSIEIRLSVSDEDEVVVEGGLHG